MKDVLAMNVARVFKGFFKGVGQIRSIRLTWGMILASLLLTGCVNYDVGVKFDHPNRGEIVQHIKLAERLTSFSGDPTQEWIDSIERRTRQLQGKTKHSGQDITVTIPFNNGAELEAKFNEFFNPVSKTNPNSTPSALPDIESHMRLNQNNLLLLVRNRLSYDLDLRSLSLISENSNVLISPGSILELKFGLNTPWGARSIESDNGIVPERVQNGRQLVWTLKPGELNHVEAVFWLPSPIGIGSVLIALFVAAGIYARYSFMPDPRTMRSSEFRVRSSEFGVPSSEL